MAEDCSLCRVLVHMQSCQEATADVQAKNMLVSSRHLDDTTQATQRTYMFLNRYTNQKNVTRADHINQGGERRVGETSNQTLP